MLHAIANRGFGPLNYALLDHPEIVADRRRQELSSSMQEDLSVMTALPDEFVPLVPEKLPETREELLALVLTAFKAGGKYREDQLNEEADAVAESTELVTINVSLDLASGDYLRQAIQRMDVDAARARSTQLAEQGERRKDGVVKLKKILAGTHFRDGKIALDDPDLLANALAIARRNQKKVSDAKAKRIKKDRKKLKSVNAIQQKTKWGTADYRTMVGLVQPKQDKTGKKTTAPSNMKLAQLKAAWTEYKNNLPTALASLSFTQADLDEEEIQEKAEEVLEEVAEQQAEQPNVDGEPNDGAGAAASSSSRPVRQRRKSLKARETEVLSSDEQDDSSDEDDSDVEYVGTKKTTRPRSKHPTFDAGSDDDDDWLVWSNRSNDKNGKKTTATSKMKIAELKAAWTEYKNNLPTALTSLSFTQADLDEEEIQEKAEEVLEELAEQQAEQPNVDGDQSVDPSNDRNDGRAAASSSTRPVRQRRKTLKARETEVLSSDEEDDSSDDEDDSDVEYVGTKKTTRPRSKHPTFDPGSDDDDDSDVEVLPPKKRRRKPPEDEGDETESETESDDEDCGQQPSRSGYLPTMEDVASDDDDDGDGVSQWAAV